MAAIDLMALARDRGFQERVRFALIDIAKDKAGAAADPSAELTFIGLVLSGQITIPDIAVAVVVGNPDPAGANDASLKTTVEQLWNFEVKAWT